jgi:hypothetical protein
MEHTPRVAALLSSHAHTEASICSRRLGDPVPGLITEPAQIQVSASSGGLKEHLFGRILKRQTAAQIIAHLGPKLGDHDGKGTMCSQK